MEAFLSQFSFSVIFILLFFCGEKDTLLSFQVPIGGQSVHYVSYKRNAFYPMKLPKYTLPKVRLPVDVHQFL